MADWADQAIDIAKRFGALIIPVWGSGLPAVKLNKDKWKDLPENKLPSDDPSIIRKWATAYDAYGVVPSTSFLIIDIDIKDGQHGKDSIKFLRDHGLPLETFSVKSPSGGLHFYYCHPTHYKPHQNAGIRALFDDEHVQQEWDTLHNHDESTGLDTRYGWGYVVGPGSETDKGIYKLVQDLPLAHIPSSMYIGAKSMVNVSKNKLPQNKAQTLGFKITENRNNNALLFTLDLRKKNLPDDQVKILIKEKLKDYDNSDGEAPTFDVMWDQYERAGDKVSDIIAELVLYKVYVSSGERVIDTRTRSVQPLSEFKSEMACKKIPIEILKANGDMSTRMVNPGEEWHSDPDRKTVRDIIYDPRKDYGITKCTESEGYIDGYYYNTFQRPIIIRVDDSTRSDVGEEIYGACVRVIENVLSKDEDRAWFKKWVGSLIFAPGFRPAWHWHIFSSKRGIGKDTLANIVTTLYGRRNVGRFDTKIFTDSFNSDLFNYGLGILSDFTKVPNNSHSVVNANFKQITGADSSRMRGMYKEGEQRPLQIRFIMISNDGTDFPVDQGDRRLYKCESEGVVLDERTYTLANCLISLSTIPVEQLEYLRIRKVTEEDVDHAKALLFKYFQTSGYEDMFRQVNCPYNETKNDYLEMAEISYIHRIETYIKHKLFVCASDIITPQSLQLLLDELHINTKVKTVLAELKNAGLIKPIYAEKDRRFRLKTGAMIYDKDMDMLIMVGVEHFSSCYAIRGFAYWCNWGEDRKIKKEYSKICGVRNIHTTGVLELENTKVKGI